MTDAARPVWFVGASWRDHGDQTERFISEGIWENGYHDRYLDRVKEMQPGDRIAIKAAYVRDHVDFDNRGVPVSTMAIKATGVIRENAGDGRHIRVDWTPTVPVREWYFYTYLKTVWRIDPGRKPMADALISFTFDGAPQDIELFLADPFWGSRYRGDRAWLVRTGQDGKDLLDRWLNEGFISLAAAHLPDLEPGLPKAEVQAAVEEGYDFNEYPQRRALTDDYYAFLTSMSNSDIVLTRHDDQAWVGRIVGEPEFDAELPRLRREVEWLERPIAVSKIPKEARSLPASPRLVTDLTASQDALKALWTEQPVQLEVPLALPKATDELAAEVHLSRTWLNEYIELLESRRQVIVYGPPGTGKTFVARKIARHVAGEDRTTVVQFHPSYAYEDFFEGLRPVTSDGKVTYEVVPGPLRTLATAAAEDPMHPYVLIIDEINRADVAKVFGELYYLLEYRGDQIALQYSPDKPFGLPKNLYLIGTMNTADRSIAMVDAAIRRRFPFIEMHPSAEPVRGVLASYLTATGQSMERAELLSTLNAQLGDSQRDFQIGPSYLMREEAQTEQGLERIWRYDILPLLEEQLYGTYSHDQVHELFGLSEVRRLIAKRQQLQLGDTNSNIE